MIGNVHIKTRTIIDIIFKLLFVHTFWQQVASNTPKTAKIVKRWHYPTPLRNVDMLLLSSFMIFIYFFSVCHSPHVAVNICIKCSFLHLRLLFYFNL